MSSPLSGRVRRGAFRDPFSTVVLSGFRSPPASVDRPEPPEQLQSSLVKNIRSSFIFTTVRERTFAFLVSLMVSVTDLPERPLYLSDRSTCRFLPAGNAPLCSASADDVIVWSRRTCPRRSGNATSSRATLTPGGKAAQAGVGVGDWVVSISDSNAEEMTHVEAQNKIRAATDCLTLALSK
ncbi:PDZ and LIM domain protein 7 [Liparis tanakae]|uniref:PDZ and LIM domain protein 7 n=1 Tax=Liparis tanakae TaxID=230148 RepID=A0A4Z2EVA2_9TELE|nr:PDZ and LIM domain protein 7 [Liparis tanakae]